MVNYHRKSGKLVQECEVACIHWSEVPFIYIGGKCYEIRSAESIEHFPDKAYISDRYNEFGRGGDILPSLESPLLGFSCYGVGIRWPIPFSLRIVAFIESLFATTHRGVHPSLELYLARALLSRSCTQPRVCSA